MFFALFKVYITWQSEWDPKERTPRDQASAWRPRAHPFGEGVSQILCPTLFRICLKHSLTLAPHILILHTLSGGSSFWDPIRF